MENGEKSATCTSCGSALTNGARGSSCPRCSFTHALRLSEENNAPANGLEAYELLYELGRGAMGVVWLAREKALDRLVALKVIPTDAHPQLAQRLLREGQAAARLRHPNIVAVHAQGGSGSSAYLAMDFIDGGNLDSLLQGKPLAPLRAAELTTKLASALAHAHTAGILHRDLKPSNILIDGKGEPHLADFGLAAPISGGGELTVTGQIAGTPAYLAPEMLGGSDAASPETDIYGLGAVLYTALTGRPPFTGESAASILTQLPNVDPPAPRLLVPTLPRDLETICIKCLEKSPTRRYPSAAALEADLNRFLRGEPIEARPVGRWEKGVRWCRRHPAAATASALAAVITLLLAVGGPLVAFRLNRAREEAEAAGYTAAMEAATTREVLEFLQNDLLGQASPANQPDRDLKLRTVVDRAAAKIETRLASRPLVEAGVLAAVAKTYRSLGEYGPAQKALDRALSIRRDYLGPEDPQTLLLDSERVMLLIDQGRYADAETLATRVLEQQKRVLGIDHVDTISSMVTLETAYQHLGKVAEADRVLRDALVLSQRVLGDEHPVSLEVQADMAFLYRTKGNLAEAERMTRQVLEVRRRILGPEHPSTFSSLMNLGAIYRGQAKFADSEAIFTELLEIARRVLGREHPGALTALNNLAVAYQDRGKFSDSAKLLSEMLEISRRVMGPEHANTLRSLANLAYVTQAEGKYDEAEKLYLQLIEMSERVLGADHQTTLIAKNNLGTLYRTRGKLAEAERLCQSILAVNTEKRGPDHPDSLRFQQNLAVTLQAAGRLDDAEALLRKNLEARQRVLGPQNPDSLVTLDSLGLLLLQRDKVDESVALLIQALAGRLKLAPLSWQTAATRSALGEALSRAGRTTEAEPLLLQGYGDLTDRAASIPAIGKVELSRAAARLVAFYRETGKPDKAAEWAAKTR